MAFDRSLALLATMASCEDEGPDLMKVIGTAIPNKRAEKNGLISFPHDKIVLNLLS